jgi:hypothetical protein
VTFGSWDSISAEDNQNDCSEYDHIMAKPPRMAWLGDANLPKKPKQKDK